MGYEVSHCDTWRPMRLQEERKGKEKVTLMNLWDMDINFQRVLIFLLRSHLTSSMILMGIVSIMCGRQIAGNDLPPSVHRTPLLPFCSSSARPVRLTGSSVEDPVCSHEQRAFTLLLSLPPSKTASAATSCTQYMYLHGPLCCLELQKRSCTLNMLLKSLLFLQNSIYQYANVSSSSPLIYGG